MAVALREEQIPELDPNHPRRKRWTRDEVESLPPFAYELIEGDLIDKMGKKRPHILVVKAVVRWLEEAFGWEFVEQESSIDVSAPDNSLNEPQPDVLVLNRPSHAIRTGNAKAADLRLIVEVADTSLQFDLRTKGPLYARAGIPEYWVVDINARQVIVHREPREGRYESVLVYGESESITPLGAPDHEFAVRGAFL